MSPRAYAFIFALVWCVGSSRGQDCLVDPTLASCSTYVYPEGEAVKNVEYNCFQMPWMVGCSIWTACQDGTLSTGNPYCEPFRVLGTQCSDKDMSGMSGCKNWAKLCLATGTAVKQCTTSPPIPSVPHTTVSQSAIVASCADHNMAGCETCTGLNTLCPDTLLSLKMVCQSMNMEMCADYNAMCAATGSDFGAFCKVPGVAYDPPMRMYFHQSVSDFILFRSWVPRTNGQYAGAIFACLFAAIFVSGIRAFRACHEAFYRIRDNLHIRHMPHDVSNASIFVLSRPNVVPHLVRSALTFVMVLVDYSLMLAAMTFNAGIFVAICLGFALGMLLFGHIPDRYAQRLQARAILSTDVECGCGTMITNAGKGGKLNDSFSLRANVGAEQRSEGARQDLEPRDAFKPVHASCCAPQKPEPSCCSSVSSSASLLHHTEPEQPQANICCSMQPILDVEDDTDQSCVEASGAMVPNCCRL